MTKKEFERRVGGYMTDHNIDSVVLGIYAVYDELTAEAVRSSGLRLACMQGCNLCCHQLITATLIEVEAIAHYLKDELLARGAKRFEKMLRRAQGAIQTWQRYLQKRGISNDIFARDPERFYRDLVGWQNPCPFIGKGGACDIYPVRPISCRTLVSTVRCTKLGRQEGRMYCRLPYDRMAHNLVNEMQAIGGGPPVVFPLVYWLSVVLNVEQMLKQRFEQQP